MVNFISINDFFSSNDFPIYLVIIKARWTDAKRKEEEEEKQQQQQTNKQNKNKKR